MKLGSHQSEESKTKISASQMGNTYALGYRHSPEVRARMSAAHMGQTAWNKGIPMTDEQRAADSAARMGHGHSPETRAKMSATRWKGGSMVSTRKHNAKRRILGFNPLNTCFDGCEGHHINQNDVIYIPHALHRSIYHNVLTSQGMEQINALSMAWLTSELTQ